MIFNSNITGEYQMKFDGFGKFFSTHGKKTLFGVGLLPVAYLAWKNRGTIQKGVSGLKSLAGGVKDRPSARLSDSRKTDMVNTVRFVLSKYDTDAFSIAYERDRERKRMGYHVRTNEGPSLFFGWSDEYEEKYPLTPFWIELDPGATVRFAAQGLKKHFDMYEHPLDGGSVLVSLQHDEMEDPRTAAGKIAELSRKLLL